MGACCSSGPRKVKDNMDTDGGAKAAPESLTRILFKCGEHCGFGCAPWEKGIVHHIVAGSQADKLGIQPGWKIHALDNEPYSFEALMDKMKGRKSYEISFYETNHFVREEEIKFEADSLGVKCDDWELGVITVVSDGPGKDAGVQPGWRLGRVNGARYSEALLDEKLAGDEPFTITFIVPVKQPAYKEVSVEFSTGQLGIGCEDWEVGYVTDCMPDTQAWSKGIQLGWKIVTLDGETYVADDLDTKLEGEENYTLGFLVPVDIELKEEKGPQVITELTVKKFPENLFYEVVNAKGVVVREAQENANRSSPKVATLAFGQKLTADERVGNRLHITDPVVGWVSLKNKKGYVLVQKMKPEESGKEDME